MPGQRAHQRVRGEQPRILPAFQPVHQAVGVTLPAEQIGQPVAGLVLERPTPHPGRELEHDGPGDPVVPGGQGVQRRELRVAERRRVQVVRNTGVVGVEQTKRHRGFGVERQQHRLLVGACALRRDRRAGERPLDTGSGTPQPPRSLLAE